MTSESTYPRDELLVARAYLSAVAEPPAPALAGFIAEQGVLGAAQLVREGAIPESVADEVDARRTTASGHSVLAAADAVGARLISPEHPEWPWESFREFVDGRTVGMVGMAEPVALWVRGGARLSEAFAASVAIVGARAASGYGEHLAAEFGHGVASAGVTVVSGAAYGIDGAAHRGALAGGGTTVAFLACGVDMDYPAGHGRLLRAIATQGAVVSEYPPGTVPRKHRFLVRNRLIAAAGQGTVVVEAGLRSGAANTANSSEALGRPLMAVPGPVSSATSVGCHEMVRAGKAVLVTATDEILEVISPLGTNPQVERESPTRPMDAMDPSARILYDVLAELGDAGADRIAQDSGLALRKVRALLPTLEMAGFVVRTEYGWSRS
ncbi:DNA-processing protein DprA [Parasphingorhabdus pacifica]